MAIFDIILAESGGKDAQQRLDLKGILPGYIILPFEPVPGRAISYSFSATFVFTFKENDPPICGHIRIRDPIGNQIAEHRVSLQRLDHDQGTGEYTESLRPNRDDLKSAVVVADLRNFSFEYLGNYQIEFIDDNGENKIYTLSATVAL